MESFTVTPAAVSKLNEIIADESEPMFLRVGVRPGGCSGFSYEMFLDQETLETDEIYEFDTVTVRLDPSSASLLQGASLDHKNTLQGGFSIDNPNAQRTCGCGQSFS